MLSFVFSSSIRLFLRTLGPVGRLGVRTMASKVEISCLMQPDHANLGGNVHGGTILQMIEQAGWISATRHCNSMRKDADAVGSDSAAVTAALVRLEHIDFMKPMHIGNIATLDAVVAYTSSRSLMVEVTVYAENVFETTKLVTNRATLWYVAVTVSGKESGALKVMPVPEIPGQSDEEKGKGRRLYLAQRADRAEHPEMEPQEVFCISEDVRKKAEPHTVSSSISTLSQVIGSSDCVQPNNTALGGVIMKLMDTVAGIVAYRHCHTNVVTACIDAINFHRPVYRGDVVTVLGRLLFTSQRSMIIEVLVMRENLRSGKKEHTTSAFFTFVSLDIISCRPLKVPPLIITNDEEKVNYERGRLRYEAAKLARKH
ncbi:cytosolic acyl coenzyme A thioester hydrolase-like [Corticium candelabrum]|uniref:cytosolic acyl coenzyme A thioester hydrolase-like n=1 Tax=Corticium candelabrum TaxID=121492 RepID=UPI002E26D116|nr:cytosolic acyl coenzyme A thioester hydrolase-like [Corticium candelabrum]